MKVNMINREMRRSLQKKETIKNKYRIPYEVDFQQARIMEAKKSGAMQGLERMYQIVLLACARVPGIGQKRVDLLRKEIIKIMTEGMEEHGA